MNEKTYNSPTGVQCPVCKRGFIKLTLHDFLCGNSTKCPICGTSFNIDKSQCAPVIDKLQNLDLASREVERLKNQSL